MAEQKTEQPTPKRIREARKRGEVFKSNDLTQAFLFLAVSGILMVSGGNLVIGLKNLLHDSLSPSVLSAPITDKLLLTRMSEGFWKFLVLAAPVMGAVFVTAGAIGFLQEIGRAHV